MPVLKFQPSYERHKCTMWAKRGDFICLSYNIYHSADFNNRIVTSQLWLDVIGNQKLSALQWCWHLRKKFLSCRHVKSRTLHEYVNWYNKYCIPFSNIELQAKFVNSIFALFNFCSFTGILFLLVKCFIYLFFEFINSFQIVS